MKAVTGLMDLTIGMRLHSVIFSLTMGVPCVGLSYADKVASHMQMLDSKDSCIPIHTVSKEKIVELVERLYRERRQISTRLLSVSDEIARDTECLHKAFLSRLRDLM